MGSTTEIVNGASSTNVYNQDGDKRELLYNRLSQDATYGVKFGTYIADERLLGIYQYFSPTNKTISTTGAISTGFDIVSAMADAPYIPIDYTLEYQSSPADREVDYNDNETIVRADFSSIYPPTTQIVSMNETTNSTNDPIIEYTLDNGYQGIVAKDNNEIKKIVYTVNGTTYTVYFFAYIYQTPADDNLTFMIEPIKEGGAVKPNRGNYITMNKFGTTANSFAEAFQNDELIDLYYTFLGMASDPQVEMFLESIVGDNITIEIDEGDVLEISSKYVAILEKKVWVMKLNGTIVRDADENNMILLPMEFFDRLTLVQKYEAVKKYLNMLSYSRKEVEVSFFQTGLFKFLFGVALLLVGIFTGQWQFFIGYVAAEAASYVLKDNPYILLFIAIVTFNPSSILTATTSILSIAASLVNIYVKYQFEEISSDIDKMDAEKQEMMSKVYSRRRQYLYEPLSNIPSLSNLTYSSYSATYDTMSYRNTERSYFGY